MGNRVSGVETLTTTMNDKFQNKYRISSPRLKNWDYGRAGAYFITICCHHHRHFFGEVRDSKMYLSTIGQIAQEEWLRTFEMRTDMNLSNDIFIVMPNHFHALISIGENIHNQFPNWEGNQPGSQSNNLPAIIRGFKGAVTSRARKIREDFRWQSRYYDNVAWDPQAFQRIYQYILNNPSKWWTDRFNRKG